MILPFSRKNRAGGSLRATAALLLCLGATLLSANGASAHDQLVSSSPQAGAHLPQQPASITLHMNAKPLNLGNEIAVLDKAGKNWVQGTATLTDSGLTQQLASGMPDAEYQVRWRAVSSDSHPISGSFEFLIGTAEAGSFQRAVTSPTSAPADAGSAKVDGSTSDAAPGTGMPAWLSALVWPVVGALVGVGAYAAFLVVRRRAQQQ